jgi:hypothetical protein
MSSAPSPEPIAPQENETVATGTVFGIVSKVFWTLVLLPGLVWIVIGSVAVVITLLYGSVRDARRAACDNTAISSMVFIVGAQQNFMDTHHTLAPAGKKVKSQLSWRVHILPYLSDEGEKLYQQFHLDEPWDSGHNRALIAQMPKRYESPCVDGIPEGKTCYLAVTGPGTAFEDGSVGPTYKDFVDGTSKTIIVVEADPDQAVIWTKPDDWEFDPSNPSRGLGNMRSRGFMAGFPDGHVRFVDHNVDVDAIKASMTRAGHEDAFIW